MVLKLIIRNQRFIIDDKRFINNFQSEDIVVNLLGWRSVNSYLVMRAITKYDVSTKHIYFLTSTAQMHLESGIHRYLYFIANFHSSLSNCHKAFFGYQAFEYWEVEECRNCVSTYAIHSTTASYLDYSSRQVKAQSKEVQTKI